MACGYVLHSRLATPSAGGSVKFSGCAYGRLPDRTVRLEAGTTKNGCGRIVSLTEECFTLLQACCLGKKQDDYVLTRDRGKRVLDFRGAWQGACVRAKLGKFVCRACEEVVTKRQCRCGSRRRKYEGRLFHAFAVLLCATCEGSEW